MTIRTRLTLWYTGILVISGLMIAGGMYHELVVEKARPAAELEKEEGGEGADVLRIILWCTLPAAIVAIGGGWWFLRQALAPVANLTRAASQINDGNLREQLRRSGNGDELDRLTEVFNSMTARLNDSFLRIREFTLHASHELKTPLTIMHGELESALHDDSLPAVQRERLLSQLDEVQRLTKIVDGLTLLTKADAGQVRLDRDPVRLDELVREAFADAQILAAPHHVKASLGACDRIEIHGDRHRLRQLLLNLTDNAVKYNQPNGTVKIDLRSSGTGAELMISNTGPGIPAESLPRVFDRFYRGSATQGNGIDGCGLGLSIAKWIVNAHGGTIAVESTPGQTTVTVRIPVNAP
jgi:signal transduction histidine kinase